MHKTRRIHDGIVGATITAGAALAYYVNPAWIVLPAVVGIAQIQSAFTGFCPVYFTLSKLGLKE